MQRRWLIFVLFILGSIPVHAQLTSWGAPPGMAGDPSPNVWGSGIGSLNQACNYGPARAVATIDDDDEVSDAKDRWKELVETKRDLARKEKELARELARKKRELERVLSDANPKMSAEDFVNEVRQCHDLWAEGLSASNAEDAAKKRSDARARVWPPAEVKEASQEITLRAVNLSVPAAARCGHAHENNQGNFKAPYLNGSAFCIREGLQENRYKDGIMWPNNPQKYNECVNAAKDLDRLLVDYDRAKAASDKAIADAKAAKDDYSKTKRQRKKEIADEKRENKELGIDDDDEEVAAPGVRDCPYCTARVKEKTNKGFFEQIMPLLQTAVAVGVPAYVNYRNAVRNANLGFPTGPNWWAPSLAQLGTAFGGGGGWNSFGGPNFGYPFNYGNSYGGVPGGGPIGCGTFIGGAPGFPNQPIGYPYGGGIYMPGFGPGGYAGPGFMGPNMYAGFNGGFGGGPGGIPPFPPPPGAFGGGFPGAPGGIPGLFGPGGNGGLNFYAGAGANFGGGSPFGSPFGSAFGSPYGAGGFGSPYGSPLGFNGGFNAGFGNPYGGFGGAYGNGFGGFGGSPWDPYGDNAQRLRMASRSWCQSYQMYSQSYSILGYQTGDPCGGFGGWAGAGYNNGAVPPLGSPTGTPFGGR